MDRHVRIVVGMDGSEGGRRALRWAVQRAAHSCGSVLVVTVRRWDDFVTTPGDGARSGQDRRDEAEDLLLREIGALTDRAGVRIASQALEGLAPEVLTRVAAEADLLVLGSHGHSAVRHIALGSVSEACVRLARCPVVVVPASTESERVIYQDTADLRAAVAVRTRP